MALSFKLSFQPQYGSQEVSEYDRNLGFRRRTVSAVVPFLKFIPLDIWYS